jgi:hypothetical protein
MLNPSFEFIKHLQGYKIGDKAEGVHKLKKYLHHFGYLNHYPQENHDHFDNLDMAIKTYQLNLNLKPTRILDGKTISRVIMPRCGMPDIIDVKTRMHAAGSYYIQYAYFDGAPKWPYILAWICSKSCEIFATISFSLPPFLLLKSLIPHHHDWL